MGLVQAHLSLARSPCYTGHMPIGSKSNAIAVAVVAGSLVGAAVGLAPANAADPVDEPSYGEVMVKKKQPQKKKRVIVKGSIAAQEPVYAMPYECGMSFGSLTIGLQWNITPGLLITPGSNQDFKMRPATKKNRKKATKALIKGKKGKANCTIGLENEFGDSSIDTFKIRVVRSF